MRWKEWVMPSLNEPFSSLDPDDIVTGGVRYTNGILPRRVSVPFASVIITPDTLVLQIDVFFHRPKYVFPRDSILSLRWQRVWFMRGVEIEHTLPTPRYVVFFPVDRELFARRLRQAGFEIAT
jgi:hypothetical protein